MLRLLCQQLLIHFAGTILVLQILGVNVAQQQHRPPADDLGAAREGVISGGPRGRGDGARVASSSGRVAYERAGQFGQGVHGADNNAQRGETERRFDARW